MRKQKSKFSTGIYKLAYLIIGLGNPGMKYDGTRHNIGFIILDYFVSVSKGRYKYTETIYYNCFHKKDVYFLKPTLYMNRSGESLAYFLSRTAKEWDDILIIHDDIDIDFGYVKYSENKGSGGHKGIESIITVNPDCKHKRCRIGIGKPPEDIDPADYVLSVFTEDECDRLGILAERITESMQIFLNEGFLKAANKYNRVNLINDK